MIISIFSFRISFWFEWKRKSDFLLYIKCLKIFSLQSVFIWMHSDMLSACYLSLVSRIDVFFLFLFGWMWVKRKSMFKCCARALNFLLFIPFALNFMVFFFRYFLRERNRVRSSLTHLRCTFLASFPLYSPINFVIFIWNKKKILSKRTIERKRWNVSINVQFWWRIFVRISMQTSNRRHSMMIAWYLWNNLLALTTWCQ